MDSRGLHEAVGGSGLDLSSSAVGGSGLDLSSSAVGGSGLDLSSSAVVGGVTAPSSAHATANSFPFALIRQASGSEQKNCFCTDLVGLAEPSHMRLGCRCMTHYNCLVQYVRVALEDKAALLHATRDQEVRKGIKCPFAGAGECLHSEGTYFMTVDDLETLIAYGKENDIATSLMPTEADKLRRWLSNDPQPELESESESPAEGKATTQESPLEDVNSDMALIDATTKPCPSCGFKISHMHGHSCHHISPSGGCPQCHLNYCYRCECSSEDNLRERGQHSSCKCGGWSNFCQPIKTAHDIKKFLEIKPYPRDNRCGCPICPDCRPPTGPGMRATPCGTCNGQCVVCQGFVCPGPMELGTDWQAQTAEMRANAPKQSFQSLLIEACQQGNLDEFRAVAAEAGADFNIDDTGSCSRRPGQPMPYAAPMGMGMGTGMGNGNQGRRSLLMYSVDSGNNALVEHLCSLGANLHFSDEDRNYAITLAAQSGFLEIMQTLVRHGALVNVQDSRGNSPLHYACETVNLEMITFLVDHCDASIDLQDSDGWTPVAALLSQSKHKDWDTAMDLLLSRNCLLNYFSSSGVSPLHSYLASIGSELSNALEPRGGFGASQSDDGFMGVKFRGARRQPRLAPRGGPNGQPAFGGGFGGAQFGRLQPGAPSPFRATAGVIPLRSQELAAAQALVEKRHRVFKRILETAKGISPFHNTGSHPSPFMLVAKLSQDCRLAKDILATVAPADYKRVIVKPTYRGNSAFSLAVDAGGLELCKMLLDGCPDADSRLEMLSTKDEHGDTPLQFLVKKLGNSINPSSDMTELQAQLYKRRLKVLELLIEQGADAQANTVKVVRNEQRGFHEDQDRGTVLHLLLCSRYCGTSGSGFTGGFGGFGLDISAAERMRSTATSRMMDVMRLLVQKGGVDVRAKLSHSRRSALHLLCDSDRFKSAQLLAYVWNPNQRPLARAERPVDMLLPKDPRELVRLGIPDIFGNPCDPGDSSSADIQGLADQLEDVCVGTGHAGETALLRAVQAKNVEAVQFLISRGCNVNALRLETPLPHAPLRPYAMHPQFNQEPPPQASAPPRAAMSALSYLCKRITLNGNLPEELEKSRTITQSLIRAGADVNHVHGGLTPLLHVATRLKDNRAPHNNNSERVSDETAALYIECLLATASEVGAKLDIGATTPLGVAVQDYGVMHLNSLEGTLPPGGFSNDSSWTALHFAAYHHCPLVAKVLIRHTDCLATSLSAKSSFGYTVLQLVAGGKSEEEMVSARSETQRQGMPVPFGGIPARVLCNPAPPGVTTSVWDVLLATAKTAVKTEKKNPELPSPSFAFSIGGAAGAAIAAIKVAAEPTWTEKDREAARNAVNATNEFGLTALMFAALRGNALAAGALLDAGADPKAQTWESVPREPVRHGNDSNGAFGGQAAAAGGNSSRNDAPVSSIPLCPGGSEDIASELTMPRRNREGVFMSVGSDRVTYYCGRVYTEKPSAADPPATDVSATPSPLIRQSICGRSSQSAHVDPELQCPGCHGLTFVDHTKGFTAIHFAARAGNVACLSRILQAVGGPDAAAAKITDAFGRTALDVVKDKILVLEEKIKQDNVNEQALLRANSGLGGFGGSWGFSNGRPVEDPQLKELKGLKEALGVLSRDPPPADPAELFPQLSRGTKF